MSTTSMIHASHNGTHGTTRPLIAEQERLVTTADDPSFLSKTPGQVETGIAREIRKHLPVLDSRETAAIAMVPVRPVLEAMAAEIDRLRDVVGGGVRSVAEEMLGPTVREMADEVVQNMLAEVDAAVRANERKRIAAEFRAKGMYAAANDIDPLGPLDGARAAGGTP